MAMNLRRGLFRLWLVASVCWMIAIALLTDPFEQIQALRVGSPIVTDEETGERLVYDSQTGYWLPTTAMASGSERMLQFRKEYPEYNDLNDEELASRIMAKALKIRVTAARDNLRASQRLEGFFLYSIVPPATAFLLGLALLWIISGFRKR